jgi:hypothetical protein
MWTLSNVFRCLPFCRIFIISMISFILPYACPVSRICCTYPDVFLLFRMSLTCSLNLVLKLRPFGLYIFAGNLYILICRLPVYRIYLLFSVWETSVFKGVCSLKGWFYIRVFE